MGGSDICDQEARRKNPSYRRIPLKALAEFGRLCGTATPKLKDVKSPVFVAFGTKEHTVAIEATRKVLGALGSGEPQVIYLQRSAHILPLDFDKEELLKKIFAFIETL
jgi:carboxylesterase